MTDLSRNQQARGAGRWARALGGLGVLAVLGLASAGVLNAQEAEAEAVEGGWVTQEQADRGTAAYNQRCAACHGEDIIGLFGAYPNAGLFYNFVSTAMPADAPGSLTPQQYADIIAYLLVANGLPIGTEELPPDQAVLSQIVPSAVGADEDEETSDAGA